MRIGAVNYLNSKPLVYGLEQLAPHARVLYDLPSRLADSLSAGRLDVALIPSVEWFRGPDFTVVSDACVACRGPVLSVKLHFRVPPSEVRRVALDEGSRTSAALTQILLAELCCVHPQWEPLPIGCDAANTNADAVLLIGDRAIQSTEGDFLEVWDLGERWLRWTGLPFVFAAWIARPGVDTSEIAATLAAARDNGVRHLAEIAAREASPLGVPLELAGRYLSENLHFILGREERAGLLRFHQLCVAHQLAPRSAKKFLDGYSPDGCVIR